MSTLDEPFSGPLVDASNGHGNRGGQHEASRYISTEVDPDDVDIVIGKAVAGIPAPMKECILKAGCIPTGEGLFGIVASPLPPSARGSASLRSSRPSSLQIEPSRPPLAVTFVEYRLAIAHMPSLLGFANF
jgi:hypothetical protein